MHSALKRASKADIVWEPFPHLIIQDALDRDLYEELAATFPAESLIIPPNPPSNKLYKLQAHEVLHQEQISPLWREFFTYHTSQAFLHDVLDVFEEAILTLYPELPELYGKPLKDLSIEVRDKTKTRPEGERPTDLRMDCQACMNSPVTELSRVRGPHVDHVSKMYAGLLYFRQPTDTTEGSNLMLYRYRKGKVPSHFNHAKIDDELVEEAKVVPYRPNTYLFYLNGLHSIHGVTPRGITPLTRRFVNTIAEFNAHPRGGLFTAPTPKAAKKKRGVLALLGLR